MTVKSIFILTTTIGHHSANATKQGGIIYGYMEQSRYVSILSETDDNENRVNIVEAMSGENGAERVKRYSAPMAEGLTYNYAAKK